jgi:hypothetical protein
MKLAVNIESGVKIFVMGKVRSDACLPIASDHVLTCQLRQNIEGYQDVPKRVWRRCIHA